MALVAQAPEGEEARNGKYCHKHIDLICFVLYYIIIMLYNSLVNDRMKFPGERLIQYATENLVTEVLIHPQTNTLLQCIRNLLASFTKHRHIIHAGYTFGGNGSWILQVLISRMNIFN